MIMITINNDTYQIYVNREWGKLFKPISLLKYRFYFGKMLAAHNEESYKHAVGKYERCRVEEGGEVKGLKGEY